MRFEFYVLNWNCNKKRVEPFNIFCNIHLQEESEKEIKKYLRAPGKYCVEKHNWGDKPDEKIFGFPAFCERLRQLIMWQEWGRCEYEISAGEPFPDNIDSFRKIDCYEQALPNIQIIARDIIYQYKKQKASE